MLKLRKFAFMLEEQCKNKEKRNDKVIVIHYYIILYYIILYICYIFFKQGKRKTRHGAKMSITWYPDRVMEYEKPLEQKANTDLSNRIGE